MFQEYTSGYQPFCLHKRLTTISWRIIGVIAPDSRLRKRLTAISSSRAANHHLVLYHWSVFNRVHKRLTAILPSRAAIPILCRTLSDSSILDKRLIVLSSSRAANPHLGSYHRSVFYRVHEQSTDISSSGTFNHHLVSNYWSDSYRVYKPLIAILSSRSAIPYRVS